MSHSVHLHVGQQRRGPSDGPGIGSGGSNSTPILFLLLFPQTTCTRNHMHAHMHICTDIEPPSAPAAPRLASPCLPPSLSLLTYYSVYAVTLTPNYNLNLPPLLPGTVVSRLPPGFSEGKSCASQPGEHAAFSGVVGLVAHWRGLTMT